MQKQYAGGRNFPKHNLIPESEILAWLRLRATLRFSNESCEQTQHVCFTYLSPWRTHAGFTHKLFTVTYMECFSPYWEFHIVCVPYLPLPHVTRKENNSQKKKWQP